MAPTQEDVARRAKVSRALVSLVFRDSPNVSPASRRKVLKAATALGYRPNALARSLASKEIRTIGVHINDITNPHMASVYAELADAAEAAGYDVLLGAGTGPLAREESLVNTLRGHQVCGLILESPFMPTTHLSKLVAGIPSVLVGRQESIAMLDVVATDELQAASLAVNHLKALGHTRIAHISGGRNSSARGRISGYKQAMMAAGLEPLVFNAEFTEEGGRIGAQAILTEADRPTAVIAGNDLIAVGAIGEFRSAGLRIPEDISIVGYDDSQIAQLDIVQLTSVRQSVRQFGQTAVALLVDRLASGRSENIVRLFDGQLVERSTTGPVSTPRKRRSPAQ